MNKRIREKLKKNFECHKFRVEIESPFCAIDYCGKHMVRSNECERCKKFKPACIWYPTNKRLREMKKLCLI